MAKHKSPGQKRKKIVQIFVGLIFIVSTYAGSMVFHFAKTTGLDWTKNHKEIVATVVDLKYQDEEYRNLKGRKRHHNVYYLTYDFKVDSNDYSNIVEVSETIYSNSKKGGNINVWYENDNPDVNDIENNIKSELSGNTDVGNMLDAAPYTAAFAYVLYLLLKIIFVRESKKTLPEGFYTENSWLDIDDNYVVVLDKNDLVYFNINDKKVDDVQDAFQKNASLEELLGMSKSSKLKRIPLSEIKELSSDHNSDVITIEHKDDSHSIEFLNQTVKSHALDRIKPHLPGSLEYSKKERTRIQAAMPSTIFFAVVLGIAYYFNSIILDVILGFILIMWVIPRIISRLIDPTITEKWLLPETMTQKT